MQARFIKRLPLLERESFIDIDIRIGTAQDPLNWDKLVQPHIVAARPNAPDAKWRWPWIVWRSAKSENALGRSTSLFCLDVPSRSGSAVPMAMMLLSEGYPALDGGFVPCVLVPSVGPERRIAGAWCAWQAGNGSRGSS
jgi:hypothetical protein